MQNPSGSYELLRYEIMQTARNFPWIRSLLMALVAILVVGCGPSHPNVLLVTFDTTRYDRLGCTGDPEARTPVVDALAERGLLFESAYSSVSLTLPAHTTMLTGLEPPVHGVLSNGKFRVPDELDTLAEILGANGYSTAAFVSAFVLDARYNLSQGFDVYWSQAQRESDPLNMTVPQRTGAEVTDEALRWLESVAESPFFLWVHYYDPHLPRNVEAPFDEMPDPYRAEIAYADEQFGRLLDFLDDAGAARDTLVVFTADHGESLGEHGERTHGIVAYDSTLHVPLILAGPGVPRDLRTRLLARHVDLLPTILAATGMAPCDDLPGRDLLQAITTGDEPDESVVGYFESRGPAIDLGWAPISGVRTGRWKFTAVPEPLELYDILQDPDETQNLLGDRPEVVARMSALYAEVTGTWDLESRGARSEDVSPEEQQQLAALGYVEAPAEFAPGEAPDPRRFVAAHGWVDSARGLAGAGRFEAAIEMLETLVESPSIRPLVLRSLAPVYAEAGHFEEAVETYRRYIELTGSSEAGIGLARALLRTGKVDEALAELALLPTTSHQAQLLRAVALVRLDRYAEARAVVDAAFQGEGRLRARAHLVLHAAPLPEGEAELRGLVAEAPDAPLLKSRLGYYLALWGDSGAGDEALSLLRQAAATDEEDSELQSNLAWGAYHLGHAEEAVRILGPLADAKSDPSIQLRLAHALAATGEEQQALEIVRSAIARRPAADWSDDARALELRLASSQSGVILEAGP